MTKMQLPSNYLVHNLLLFACCASQIDACCFDALMPHEWRKRSIPTHSGWLYPLTFDAGKGLKEA